MTSGGFFLKNHFQSMGGSTYSLMINNIKFFSILSPTQRAPLGRRKWTGMGRAQGEWCDVFPHASVFPYPQYDRSLCQEERLSSHKKKTSGRASVCHHCYSHSRLGDFFPEICVENDLIDWKWPDRRLQDICVLMYKVKHTKMCSETITNIFKPLSI